MATTYRVTAPLILLQVKDQAGRGQVNAFYEGAIVADPVNDDRLKKAVERNWVEKVDAPAPQPAVADATSGAVDPAAKQPAGDQVPDGTTDEVMAWVGTDRDRADRALAAEQARERPRTTLIGQLEKIEK